MNYVGRELRLLRREVVRLNRKVALARMPGKVIERDDDKGLVRLDLGEDPATGEMVKGPWVRVERPRAGSIGIYAQPDIGEQMYLASASGVVGADSVACFGCFDEEHPAPDDRGDILVLAKGSSRIELSDVGFRAFAAGSEIRLDDVGVHASGAQLTHNTVSVGDQHVHTEVEKGGALSGPPPGDE